jgi:small subunit ribosomal protein S21
LRDGLGGGHEINLHRSRVAVSAWTTKVSSAISTANRRESFSRRSIFCSPGWLISGAVLSEDLVIVQIFVRDNNVDQALKALKKKMQREGSFREMKRHVHYEKPSEKRARQKAEAVRRARKLARKRLQREGLLPAPKKVVRT